MRFENWIDAKHYAAEESLIMGYAYITENKSADKRFGVTVREHCEDAPASFVVEFKDGTEQ